MGSKQKVAIGLGVGILIFIVTLYILMLYSASRVTKIHQELYTLLSIFDRVCKDHDLEYWVIGGTLLGAVRSGNIIPWDDDADVTMLSPDYENLAKVDLAPYGLHLSNGDPGQYKVQLVNGRTSAFLDVFARDLHKGGMYALRGIWRDRFPTDLISVDSLQGCHHLRLGNLTLCGPRNPEVVLEQRYGSNWRVPINQGYHLFMFKIYGLRRRAGVHVIGIVMLMAGIALIVGATLYDSEFGFSLRR